MRSAAIFLVEGVRAWFAENGVDAAVDFGPRGRTKTINQGPGGANRVVITDKGGAFVPDLGMRGPGGNPRPLVGRARKFEIYVWAIDLAAPRDELRQIEATDCLLERVIQAVHHTLRADATWVDAVPTEAPVEDSFGRETVATLLVREVFFDRPLSTSTAAPVLTTTLHS